MTEMPRTVTGAAFAHVRRRMAASIAYAQALAGDIEGHMKQDAPWQDITGDARGGLRAEPVVDQKGNTTVIDIVLSHSVSYGIWLEVAHGGKWGIVGPSAMLYGPRFGAGIKRIWAGSGLKQHGGTWYL
jgi:hypothetical protein